MPALPWVAPTLMHFGFTGPAHVLYFVYGPFCHQFAFRSFFLFGEQPAYPRAISGTTLKPYESYIANSPEFNQALSNWVGTTGRSYFQSVDEFDPYVWSSDLQFASKDFFGDPQMGYKLAVCERDIAIYTALFFGGLIYSIPYRAPPPAPCPDLALHPPRHHAYRYRRLQPAFGLSAVQSVGSRAKPADLPGGDWRAVRLDERLARLPLPGTVIPRYPQAA